MKKSKPTIIIVIAIFIIITLPFVIKLGIGITTYHISPESEGIHAVIREYFKTNDELDMKFGNIYDSFIVTLSIKYDSERTPVSAKVGTLINFFHPYDVWLEYRNGEWIVVKTKIYF